MLMCLLVVCTNEGYNDNVFENDDGDGMLCVRWDLLKCFSSPVRSLFHLEMDVHLSFKISRYKRNKSQQWVALFRSQIW